METIQLARYFADFLNKYGAQHTEIIEAKNNKMFEYIIVCSAENKLVAQTLLVDLLEYAKHEFRQINCGLEGYKKGEWIIIDFGKLVVHIFLKDIRNKFSIERLWK